jgi:hypothetical protein
VAIIFPEGSEKHRAPRSFALSLHRFRVGQSVSFVGGGGVLSKATGVYSITKLLPETDGDGQLQYRLKSARESHERVAKESELQRT